MTSGTATGPAPAPRLSVCIPAYNRPRQLEALLDSVFAQDYRDCEVVICEDGSPERPSIREVAERYGRAHPGRLRYFENAANLGYDANLRELLRRARGEYAFIMGNDDLVAPGALAVVATALDRYPGVGVVLRSFESWEGEPENVVRVSRYYPHEVLVPPGADAVVAFFRRLTVMSGIVLHRAGAVAHATDAFDGTLFYQHHVASRLLMERPGLFVPQILARVRVGGVPEFGTSARERGRFVPGAHPPSTDLRMIEGQLAIASRLDVDHGGGLYARIHRDFGQYLYPSLAQQAHQPARAFLGLYRDLARLGFWRYPLFHAYAWALLLVGREPLDRAIMYVRRRLGYTPRLNRDPATRPAPAPRAPGALPSPPGERA